MKFCGSNLPVLRIQFTSWASFADPIYRQSQNSDAEPKSGVSTSSGPSPGKQMQSTDTTADAIQKNPQAEEYAYKAAESKEDHAEFV